MMFILANLDTTLNWPAAVVLCALILGGAYVMGKVFG